MTRSAFVWHELLTPDVEGAGSFFGEVVGWTTTEAPVGPMTYSMFCDGDRPLAGLMTLPPKAVEAGAPPHWLGHVEVDDADATSARVVELGGAIMVPTQTIADVGKFAVVADPQGAVFSVFTPDPQKASGGEGRGAVAWNELNTTSWEAAWDFYAELLGWTITGDMDMGPEHGVYRMFTAPGCDHPLGGMSDAARHLGSPPYWLYYISVPDLDAALARVKSHGGALLSGPMNVPGGDRVAQCRDPQGATFALHQSAS